MLSELNEGASNVMNGSKYEHTDAEVCLCQDRNWSYSSIAISHSA